MADSTENIHGGHRLRLRKRFLAEGMTNMEPHEILEMALFYAIPLRNTSVLAHRLIRQFGSFSGVLEAPCEELLKVEGISERTAAFIKLLLPLCNAYAQDKYSREIQIRTMEDLKKFTLQWFSAGDTEKVVAFLLDARGKILFCDEVFEGRLTDEVDTKRLVQILANVSPDSLVLVHYRPDEASKSTVADRRVAMQVSRILQFLEVYLKAYIVLSKDHYQALPLAFTDNSLNF